MTKLEKVYQEGSHEMDERNETVLQELPQVYYIAMRIRERLPHHVDLEDLVNAGVVGLIEAYAKYDSSKNASFSTFAKFRIRGAILDSLRSIDWGSRTTRRKGRAIAAATSRLASVLGRQPLQEEIAEDLKIPIAELHATLTEIDALCLVGQNIETSDEGQEPYDLIENAPNLREENPFDLCLKSEMRGHLVEALRMLSEREQMILAFYYQEELTMREISEILGIGTSRVSQILTATLAKLRARMAHLSEVPKIQPVKNPVLLSKRQPLSTRVHA
jgi:RNA polymerase sigma factor for flagellar operon FliA